MFEVYGACATCGENFTSDHKCAYVYWTEVEKEQYRKKLREMMEEYKKLKEDATK